jgi:hypothetical protein
MLDDQTGAVNNAPNLDLPDMLGLMVGMGFSAAAGYIVALVHASGGRRHVRPYELAKTIGITGQSLSVALKTLVACGVVAFHPDKTYAIEPILKWIKAPAQRSAVSAQRSAVSSGHNRLAQRSAVSEQPIAVDAQRSAVPTVVEGEPSHTYRARAHASGRELNSGKAAADFAAHDFLRAESAASPPRAGARTPARAHEGEHAGAGEPVGSGRVELDATGSEVDPADVWTEKRLARLRAFVEDKFSDQMGDEGAAEFAQRILMGHPGFNPKLIHAALLEVLHAYRNGRQVRNAYGFAKHFHDKWMVAGSIPLEDLARLGLIGNGKRAPARTQPPRPVRKFELPPETAEQASARHEAMVSLGLDQAGWDALRMGEQSRAVGAVLNRRKADAETQRRAERARIMGTVSPSSDVTEPAEAPQRANHAAY